MIIDDISNKVICDDCLNILPQLPNQCVDLIFADPPYNNNCNYSFYKDNLSLREYCDWCKRWFIECRRIARRVIITPGHGNFWMWGEIEKPWGVGSWFKPGNPSSSVLGWCCWEPWLYYCHDYKVLGGPDTIRVPVNRQTDTGNHPCPKPLALLKWLIEKATKENQIVLDPFSGSGTTCLAAKILKRKFAGIEIDANYVKIARKKTC